MLGNTTCFACCNVCITKCVQQRCFTMINVAHNRYNRCTWSHVFWIWSTFQNVCIRFNINTFYSRTKFTCNQFCCICINRLIHGNHHSHFHQFFDNITNLFRHCSRQIFYRYRITQRYNVFNLLWDCKHRTCLFTETF